MFVADWHEYIRGAIAFTKIPVYVYFIKVVRTLPNPNSKIIEKKALKN
jgi:hypothetical protein